VLGARAPRPSVDADVGDAAGEGAVDELRAERLPAIDPCAVEAAALETGLTRADGAQVGLVEAAVAEDAPPPGGEERLEAAVERLSAEVAVLECAALRRDGVERRAPEVGVTDRDAVEHEDA
jgi:hypothetical protein